MSNIPVITSEIFVAYTQCPRKAFLLLFSEDKGTLHEYPLILEKYRAQNRIQYLGNFLYDYPEAKKYSTKFFRKDNFLLDATLVSEQLEAYCAVLTKVDTTEPNDLISYEPTIIIGTYTITPEQKMELFFAGAVLGRIQKLSPSTGQIVSMDEKVHRVQLKNGYKSIMPFLRVLQNWCNDPPTKPPDLILNKHCQLCQFREICQNQAKNENHLSLLDRMTPKAIQKFNKRGIFTIQQLSYLFKPHRKLKRRKNPEPIKHSMELQALAIRDKKIYIQEMPKLNRESVEIFLDIEGIPDQHFYYLIGLLVCNGQNHQQYSLWADDTEEEAIIWNQFVAILDKYPEAIIYHYGNYEIKAISELAKRYQTDIEITKIRFNNINSQIYGKVYFPIFSNRLKDIGAIIGASWQFPNVSGITSLIWRYEWENTRNTELKENLLIYNKNDCSALKLLTEKITEILAQEELNPEIIVADKIQKLSTEIGEKIHTSLEIILKSSHIEYEKRKIALRRDKKVNKSVQERKKGKGGCVRIYPAEINKKIEIPALDSCKSCGQILSPNKYKKINQIIVDLNFNNKKIKKTIFLYESFSGFCEICKKRSKADIFSRGNGNYVFGHGFMSWLVYQRISLRLPFRLIVQNSIEMFNEPIALNSINNILKYFAKKYYNTEHIILKRILNSPFVHADETQINIQGLNQYVWTFTDGKNVIFKLTKTREATIVHETLKEYSGVLVSDFYSGYDSVHCKQQKCWVHLIGDINDDLWDSPFDNEYEMFVLELKNLIFPIFDAIDKYGLKERHLRKFKKNVDQFYKDNIFDKNYHSELTTKYQKRLEKYQNSLFIFLEFDSIPWHNNTAERALRHFAVQRKISGTFFETGATSYLSLLGIMQTCNFQEKSFLKFLASGESDVDFFKSPKIRRRVRAVNSNLSIHDNN